MRDPWMTVIHRHGQRLRRTRSGKGSRNRCNDAGEQSKKQAQHPPVCTQTYGDYHHMEHEPIEEPRRREVDHPDVDELELEQETIPTEDVGRLPSEGMQVDDV